jgi:hypothetical protein
MMCHRDYFKFPITDSIDKTVRKVREERPTRPMYITQPTIRGFSHAFHAGVDFRREGTGGN